jgi:hypothetical protein
MTEHENVSELTDGPVCGDPIELLLLSGKAQTFEEAEEMYLDNSLPAVYRLLESPLSNEDLAEHPLIRLLCFRGSRGWEDSL